MQVALGGVDGSHMTTDEDSPEASCSIHEDPIGPEAGDRSPACSGHRRAQASPKKSALRWLHRDGAAAGTTTLLQDAIASLPVPADDGDLFVWAGCEFSAFKAIRNRVRKHWKLARSNHLVASYWRRGSSEDGAAQIESAAET